MAAPARIDLAELPLGEVLAIIASEASEHPYVGSDRQRDAWDEVKRRDSELREALQQIADQQPQTLAMIERNEFVFTDIGCEPGNWQHLAFSVYTDLCRVDSIARAALASFGEPAA